jgi:hypothetical protein
MEANVPIVPFLPRRGRGRLSTAAQAAYDVRLQQFCALILQIRSRMDFAVGSRDWCYLLESEGLRKGEFDACERLITACRKSGALPLDICADDNARETVGLEEIDNKSITEEVASWQNYLRNVYHESYTPISFWESQEFYVEVVVEKLGLRNLFEPVCSEFYVPIQNFKGWSDLNLRARMMRRFNHWETRSKRCVLLVCMDHDPGGLLIADAVRKNLADLSGAVGWSPENLIVIRFGLTADFIDRHSLTWIDNLETGSGLQLDDPDHSDHFKRHVQDYIAEFGVRKCEANALVARPELGRKLMRDAISKYVRAAAPKEHRAMLESVRLRLRRALRKVVLP